MPDDLIKQLVRESNLIEGFDDPEFDDQGMIAWEYLEGVALDQLDHHCIKKVQKILTLKQTDLQPDWRGHYRNIQVSVGNHTPPLWTLVEGIMDSWLLNVHAHAISPIDAHKWFENIHPFVDGNGRTGRLLLWWMEIRLGQKPTLIFNATKQEYYAWFK